MDFTKNNDVFKKGKSLRKSFESVLSNLDDPPNVIEREKLSQIIERIQDERNLQEDFGKQNIEELQAAKVDYVIYGNFIISDMLSDIVEFQSECIKISGENVSSKIGFPTISFKQEELSNLSSFESKIRKMLNQYSFLEGFGMIENEKLNEINKRLDEKDKQIDKLAKLLKENQAKEDSTFKLKNTPPDVDFSLGIIDEKLIIYIKFNNNVPIKFIPRLHAFGPWECENGTKFYDFFRTAAHLNPIEIYPPNNKDKMHSFIFDTLENNESLPNDKFLCMTMYITYSSIFAAEIQKPELQEKNSEIDYVIEPYTMRFVPTKFKRN
ncbi:MAG: hypothetical protein DHS20C18_45950 [Saprospiraceae bacterium]|nr:MAG: hypothetical protein DHS20C18_45950 [Saprospiraceae bacterium]